ncbi:beta-aspartyl-peptidase [Prevotella sp. KH2C16]|uniref:beta-aspartyl-peptidase n=1 Tax=Prevotella sp. KH2C16 TaxID=1855325 RepID=UPI0008E72728|nr:beta-aspartyl-peptidase [Prevotella sp. KH2C16]SFG17357.1 beta-aspartyl-dipeptidase (metallo-type) [Prevotella sp. KH2C16]
MFTLIKNIHLYTPEDKGIQEILLAGEKIVAIGDRLEIAGTEVKTIDGQGMTCMPGLIDQHVHVIGGGGQTGYFSLAPEVPLSKLIEAGTTTVVGLLGTDGFVKTLPQLYAKTKGLCQDGISAYMLTGFYGLPTPTITSSIAEDMIYIDRCIGCKIAISDDRSSYPTKQELLRIIQQVRLGGFTSAKGGIMHVHLGALSTGIEVLIDIAREIPNLTTYISPTHMGRTHDLFLQGIEFAKLGGMIDISTGGTKYAEPHETVMEGLEAGVPIDLMTFSSDGNAGVRRKNAETGEDTYLLAPLHKNLEQVVCLIKEDQIAPEEAFKLITVNPAKNMKLHGKGRISVGVDADLTFFDDQWNLQGVWARGIEMMHERKVIKKGNFEQ